MIFSRTMDFGLHHWLLVSDFSLCILTSSGCKVVVWPRFNVLNHARSWLQAGSDSTKQAEMPLGQCGAWAAAP